VTRKIAAALAGKPASEKQPKGGASKRRHVPASDSELIRLLAERLNKDGPSTARLREAITKTIRRGDL
jgi:hypothetical protein